LLPCHQPGRANAGGSGASTSTTRRAVQEPGTEIRSGDSYGIRRSLKSPPWGKHPTGPRPAAVQGDITRHQRHRCLNGRNPGCPRCRRWRQGGRKPSLQHGTQPAQGVFQRHGLHLP
jgi:hypothetical protein